jgi:beta-galactosidase
MPDDYFTHLEGQYTDMVNEHMNHPCIIFWGLSNETQTGDTKDSTTGEVTINGKDFAKAKAELYSSIIKGIHPEAWVGYVVAQGATNPSAHYNNPNLDWFGCNIYVGWYASPNSNNPSSEINKRITSIITNKSKILCYSEYGCGGTQSCHSDDPLTTTTRGNHERHDIEYMMWLHEGQIATIKQFPQLMFTSQWQLFDIAVASRNEGYTVCLDGETTSIDDELRRLNNKGLVERDHVTRKDPFYLYKAWWNPTPFIHICGKDYTKTTDRVIKCYTNDTGNLSLKVNGTTVETKTATDNILTFTA